MNDYMIRATAAEGQIRAFAATTRDMVENAKNAHKPGGYGCLRTSHDSSCHDGR